MNLQVEKSSFYYPRISRKNVFNKHTERLFGTLKYKRFVLYIMVVFENPLFVLLLRRALFRTFIVVSMLLD